MISKELAAAREYEKEKEKSVADSERSAFHLSPRIGWLNDPNGFSFFGGKYHLFYQYHPYNSLWGPMHWGHAVSDDMIAWKYLPCALAPDKDYDKSGCFSGTAMTLPDGRQLLMYTGCGSSKEDPLEKGRWMQSQCIAVSDTVPLDAEEAVEFTKYEGNPVIDDSKIPAECDPYEFRDPYLWKAKDGSYMMLASIGRTGEITEEKEYRSEKGTQLLLYRSDDCFEWSFDSVLFEDEGKIGIMWECPNFCPLGDRWVLIASPMDMAAEAGEAEGTIRFPKGSNVCYITGDFDEESGQFSPERERNGKLQYRPVDVGLDFYAPQVMKTPDGRTVMIAWMQDPKPSNSHDPEEFRVFGQMTLPRELTLKEGRLYQWPVKELEAYREDAVSRTEVELNDEPLELEGLKGREFDIELSIKPKGAYSYSSFTVSFCFDDDHHIDLIYDPVSSVLTIDRRYSNNYSWNAGIRSVRAAERDGAIDLRLLIDRYSAEVFVNGGEQAMALTYYAPAEADRIRFSASGSAVMDVKAYRIKL